MNIYLPLDTIQKLLAYLGSRPYNEAAALVNAIAGPAQAQIDDINKPSAPPPPPPPPSE